MRSAALDVFRGLTIAFMVLVNNPGGPAYAPLRHADWHGWTPTDLVFPFFLFIVGAAIPFSLDAFRARGGSGHRFFVKILRRSAILFLLGLLLSGFPRYDLSTIRIPGVLQRIALCYLIAATLSVFTTLRGRVAWVVLLLAAHTIFLTALPVPGVGRANLGKETNLGAWLDRTLLSGHLWSQSRTWDPEGLLGTLSATATTLVGAIAGSVLMSRATLQCRLALIVTAGAILSAAGLVLDVWLPINKPLWTASYVLVTGGLGLLLLAVLEALFGDGRARSRIFVPFVALGRNAILVFVLSGLFARTLSLITLPNEPGSTMTLRAYLVHSVFQPVGPPKLASLAFALSHVALFALLSLFLHRHRLYLRVG
jgi:predicted acyltransferase